MSLAEATDNNEVLFYLDGSHFFPALDQALQAVAAAPRNPLTYVRIAYWLAEHDFPLVDPLFNAVTVQDLLETRLREVAFAGHRVEVILFAPSRLEAAGASLVQGEGGLAAGLLESDLAMERFLNGWTSSLGTGRIQVYLERVNRWVPGVSNHQKIALCVIAGQRSAFVGGFNLAASYWDTPAHDFHGHTWHDTGVRLRGPATDAVEAEWMRRWRSSGQDAVENTTPQTTYGPVGGQTVRVTVATTNSEGWFREADIQRELVRLIGNAQQYMYFENYGFTDPTLVDALGQRLGAPHGPIPDLFVNVAWPKPPFPLPALAPYDYLDYIAWAKLALPTCVSVQVPDPANPGGGPLTVPRAAAVTWRIRESANVWSTLRSLSATVANRWMEEDALVWQLPGGPIHATPLPELLSIQGGLGFHTACRATTASTLAPIYIHSKLALFDDEIAVIGTANFTYRSMVYDGEMDLIIENPALVTGIRQSLFTHFNTAPGAVLDPAHFTAEATANRQAYTAGTLQPGYLYVLPLEFQDFTQAPPAQASNFTWF